MMLRVLWPGSGWTNASKSRSYLLKKSVRDVGMLGQAVEGAAIAERLVLAEKSVENQLTAIYGELGIDRREEAVHPRVRAVLVYLRDSQHGP
jgi:DNA-binding NarL/FixJ family response regulator